MTDQEKANATDKPWLFDDNDVFVDYNGRMLEPRNTREGGIV
jgi:hypothetical protein